MTTETPTFTEVAARLRHDSACVLPAPYATRGNQGDAMIRCRNCGRFELLNPSPTDTRRPTTPATLRRFDSHPVATPPPEPVVVVVPVVALLSAWRCRDHNAPVSWKGKGCQRCDDARRYRPRKPKPETVA